MRLYKNILFSLAGLFLLNACEYYQYTPQNSSEQPSTIQYAFNGNWEYNSIMGGEIIVFPETVIGTRLHEVNGKSVDRLRSSPTIKNDSVTLSPGTNELAFFIVRGKAKGDVSFLIEIEPNTHYTIDLSNDRLQILNGQKIVKEIFLTTRCWRNGIAC